MRYRYSKYTGEDLDGVDLEELLSRLSDLLLSSGFDNPYGLPHDDEAAGYSMQAPVSYTHLTLPTNREV